MVRTSQSIRRAAVCVAATLLLLLPAVLHAQVGHGPAGPLWESYSRAAEVLERAVEAHGGAAAIRGLAALWVRWEGEDYAPTQGRVPSETFDTTGNARLTIQDARVDLAGRRYLFDREFHFPGGYLNAVRIAGTPDGVLFYNPHGERGMLGTTFGRDESPAAARRNLAAVEGLMPVLLIRSALLRAATLRYVGVSGEGVAGEEAIAFTTPDGDVVTLYVDAATGRVTRREIVGAGSLGDEVNTFRFSDYLMVSGFLVPHLLEVRWNGLLTGRHRLTGFSPEAELPEAVFEPPADHVAGPPAAAPAVVRIAEGLAYVENLGGGYRMLVADTDEGVVVVDAPVSPDVTEVAIRLIAEAFPGRPVRYVVITHHHGDHIAGIPAIAARGATILVAPGSEDYLRRMATVVRTFGRIGTPPAAVVTPHFETMTGRRTIGRGDQAIEIIDVGPTSHAASMLAVYVPSQQLLFQGDLLRINAHGGPVVAPAAARDLDALIRRFRLDVRSIGAVHGLNGTMADLREALERAAEVR